MSILSTLMKGHLKPITGFSFAEEGEGGEPEVTEDSGADDIQEPANWYDGFSDDIKSDATVQKYKSSEEAAKALIHANKKISEKGVIIPKENATQEEKDAYLTAIGRPVAPSEYKFTPIEDVHESAKFSPEFEKILKEHNFANGKTQAQADADYRFMQETLSNAAKQKAEADEKSFNETSTKLRGEWGHMYEGNVMLGKKVVEKYGGTEALQAMQDVGNNPAVLKMLANFGKAVSEDSIKNFGVSSLTTDSKSAEAKIREIMGNKDHPYHRDVPEHKKAVEEMTELHKIAYGGGE